MKIAFEAKTFLKWFLMWSCDVVPWVSGWTIAFLLWIYDRLIKDIASFDIESIKLLLSLNFAKFWKKMDMNFLVSLFLWIVFAIFSLAKLVQYLLLNYPIQIYSFFVGLMIASLVILFKNIKFDSKNIYKLLLFLILWIFVWYIWTSLSIIDFKPNLFTTFFVWMVAIIAMILPWISWSYLLLMLNYYHYLIDIVANINLSKILILLVFVLWAVFGLLLFSKILNFIKNKYPNILYTVLTWIIVGSIHVLWPRKKVIKYYLNSKWQQIPLIQVKVLPLNFIDLLSFSPFFFLGLFFVLIIYKAFKTTFNK